MILYLRDQQRRTILDVEVFIKNAADKSFIELNSTVIIKPYSELLLKYAHGNCSELIETFDELSELRGWLWESYFIDDDNNIGEYGNVVKILKERLCEVALKYDLYYVED